jgi:hypothetical protein
LPIEHGFPTNAPRATGWPCLSTSIEATSSKCGRIYVLPTTRTKQQQHPNRSIHRDVRNGRMSLLSPMQLISKRLWLVYCENWTSTTEEQRWLARQPLQSPAKTLSSQDHPYARALLMEPPESSYSTRHWLPRTSSPDQDVSIVPYVD